MKEIVEIPEGTEFTVSGQQILAKGPSGEVSRLFPSSRLSISKKDSIIEIENKIKTAASRILVGTFKAHIKNMLKGVQEPFVYKLKAASVHFPMNLSQSENTLKIVNFLGSKKPIEVKIPSGAEVSVEGSDITISSPNIEIAGMTATRMEQATRLTNKDRRVFQDGIFITEKAGKPIK